MKLKITTHGDDDATINVTGEYTPPRRGSKNEYGVPMEPDEDSAIEILEATDEFGTARDLTVEESDRAKDALWEAVREL